MFRSISVSSATSNLHGPCYMSLLCAQKRGAYLWPAQAQSGYVFPSSVLGMDPILCIGFINRGSFWSVWKYSTQFLNTLAYQDLCDSSYLAA